MWTLWLLATATAIATPDVAALDATLRAHADAGRLNAVVRLQRGDEILLHEAYGAARPDDRCRIGSVSKPLTSATIHALHDRGALSVDDPVARWLPDVGAIAGDGLTLRHLLTHRGGLSEPAINPWVASPPTWDAYAAVALPQLTVVDPPGAVERYSNFGYTLLAEIAGRAHGGSYADALQAHVVGPLGLEETGLLPGPDPRELRGHLLTPLGLVDAQAALPRLLLHDHRWPMAGDGALTSSPADLVRFATALREGRLLSDETRQAMLRPAGDGQTAAGWVVEEDRIWHNGALVPLGAYAWLRWAPDDDHVLALCATPSVSAVTPEWGAVAEAALAGAPIDVSVRPSLFGWIAGASTLRLHLVLGALGLVVAPTGRSTLARVGSLSFGVGLALLGFGLHHAAWGLAGAALAVGIAAAAARVRPPETSGGKAEVFGLLVGLATLGMGALGLAGLVALGWLMDNLWTLAG